MTSNSNSLLSRARTNDELPGDDRHLRPPSPSSPGAPATRRAGRPGRRLGVLAGAVALLVTLTGCNLPVSQWVPDFNKDGKIDQTEIDRQTKVIADSMAKGLESQRRQTQLHPFLVCVRRHESDRGAYPHVNGYVAQNPRSSASGAYQYIDSSWRTLSARAGYPGYARAKFAPWWVQDAVTLHTFKAGGRGHWNGTGC